MSTEEPLILTEVVDAVGVIRLNRPKKLNALSPAVIDLVAAQMERWDADPAVRVIVLTGNDRAFAAGADIDDMTERSAVEMYERDQFTDWDRIRRVRIPIIAAVSGFALGGGCELVMLCDLVVAGDTAQFGQPEINLGVIPGAGGTQRLTRAVGKALAMDMILTGRMLSAPEAMAAGLVSRVVPPEHVLPEAMKIAQQLAARGSIAVRFAKECVLKAFETTMEEGVMHERRLFYMLFATQDQKEGMRAFAGRRPARFEHR